MGPNVIIRRDKSGSVTVEISLSPDQSTAFASLLHAAANVLQGETSGFGKSPETTKMRPAKSPIDQSESSATI